MSDHLPCHDKRRYATGAKARAATTTIRTRGRGPSRNEAKPARAYPCPDCHGWHLTSSLTTDRRIR